MNQISTQFVAEHMLKTGKQYSAATLGLELGINSKVASAKLFNIRVSSKYECLVTQKPNRKIKVTSIDGVTISKGKLWDLAIFNKPLNLEVLA
jgi:hypothetical protein